MIVSWLILSISFAMQSWLLQRSRIRPCFCVIVHELRLVSMSCWVCAAQREIMGPTEHELGVVNARRSLLTSEHLGHLGCRPREVALRP